jgi:hypothetical protein
MGYATWDLTKHGKALYSLRGNLMVPKPYAKCGGYWFLGLLDDDTNQKLATTYPLGTWSLQRYWPSGGGGSLTL